MKKSEKFAYHQKGEQGPKVTPAVMAWATTSELNGRTKWHGRGHPEYHVVAAMLGEEVRSACVRGKYRAHCQNAIAKPYCG